MHPNRGEIAKLDADEDVTLEKVAAEVAKDVDIQERLEESQAHVYHLDLEYAQKVLSMQDDEAEPAELKEVIKVVTTAKLMTEVVIAAATTITAALMPKAGAAKRRKGVVIRHPEETDTSSVIVHFEPKIKICKSQRTHTDPTKVRVGKRETTEREVKLLTLTEGHTVPLDPPASAASGGSSKSIDKLFDEEDDVGQEHPIKRDDDVSIEAIAHDVPKALREDYCDAPSNVDGKSLAAICGLIPEGFSVSSDVMEPPVVTHTSDVGPTDFMSELNLRTRPPVTIAITTIVVANVSAVLIPKVRVVSKNLDNIGDYASASKVNEDATSVSKLNKASTLSGSFNASLSLDTETMHRIYVPKWTMKNDSILEDAYVFHDLTDRLFSPTLFAQLCAMDYDQLYTEFNVGCTACVSWGRRKDVEIANLKSLLSLKESEAVEAICLRSQLSIIEAADAAKVNELKELTEKSLALEKEKKALSEKLSRDNLNSKIASLESERDSLVNQRSSLESTFELLKERMQATWRWILTHGLKLILLKCLHSTEYLRVLRGAIGCAINKGMQDGLAAGIDHGKAGRDISMIKAYGPSVEAKYANAVEALRVVDFLLLSELKSKKYASMTGLMDSLRLEGLLTEIPGAKELHLSLEQLMLPIHREEDNGEVMEKRLSLTDVMDPLAEPLSSKSLTGEPSTSAIPAAVEPITTLSTTFAPTVLFLLLQCPIIKFRMQSHIMKILLS
nr:hypothetical protein [Tanacetum cinerariifolium]